MECYKVQDVNMAGHSIFAHSRAIAFRGFCLLIFIKSKFYGISAKKAAQIPCPAIFAGRCGVLDGMQ